MHIDGSPECLILVQKHSECLNSLFQLIYFLLTVSILGFRQMRSQNLTWKKCCMLFYATPKFWHKIQDSQKSVEHLLNRSRVALGKSFFQL